MHLKGDIEFELLELFLTLDDFLADPNLRSRHLKTDHVTIYVRRSVRAFTYRGSLVDGYNCLDLADMTVAEAFRGHGIMRRFVEYASFVSPYHFILLENVLNDIVTQYALRHDWNAADGVPNCYWKERGR